MRKVIKCRAEINNYYENIWASSIDACAASMLSRKEKKKARQHDRIARGLPLQGQEGRPEIAHELKKQKKKAKLMAKILDRERAEHASTKQVSFRTRTRPRHSRATEKIRACAFCVFPRQDCARHHAEIDLEMRLQREKHLKETTKMALANDEARIAANAAHQADRNSHKAMKIATDTFLKVNCKVQLAQGSIEQVAKVARRCMDIVPVAERAAVEAALVRPAMALSASSHAISESICCASSELVTASVQSRKSNTAVNTYFRYS